MGDLLFLLYLEKSPEELVAFAGFDLSKEEFWQLGMKQYEDFVSQLEELI
ncbi:MAG: hypothetical protein J7J21_02770 [Methanomicrobia archaeon]|nr:hypothetical protein [Methanomicrobia archaeon]